MKMLSRAGVMHMDHIILDEIIGKYGWQFILVINTVMNKFQNVVTMKFRKGECIKSCIVWQQQYHVVHSAIYAVIYY